MFLDLIRKRNQALVEQSIALHQAGRLPSNCYVLDLDQVEHNARHIAQTADRYGMKAFAMTKQVGRNPAFCRAVMAGGISHSVAVDAECARATHRAGMAVGHVGHLVQIPRYETEAIEALNPAFWTALSLEQATRAGEAAQKRGRTQPILARLAAPGDRFYRGHEGGFPADRVLEVSQLIDGLAGASFAGITSFPTQLFDAEQRAVVPTPNMRTLKDAANTLAKSGLSGIEFNAPGTTSSAMIPMVAENGATQVEPGHGLTGTTPLHLADENSPEIPAILYLSEVSHLHGNEAFCFGGGLYIDPVVSEYPARVLTARGPQASEIQERSIQFCAHNSIDYYGMIDAMGPAGPRVGDSVIMGFRAQAFITRAYVAGVKGIATGNATVESISDVQGHPVAWPN